MTTIFYETFPVAHLTFEGEWRLDYDPTWEARRSAFLGFEELQQLLRIRCQPFGGLGGEHDRDG